MRDDESADAFEKSKITPEAIIMIGLPGSGKTTWVMKNYGRNPKAVLCSADALATDAEGKYMYEPKKHAEHHKVCLLQFINYCSNKKQFVIVDNTNCNIHSLAPYISIARAFDYKVRLMFANQSDAFSRQTHNVPETTWHAMRLQLNTMLAHWPGVWPELEKVDQAPTVVAS
jgi:hypothetical protein